MKLKAIISTFAALSITVALPAFAVDSVGAHAAQTATTGRVISIAPGTTFVNVTRGEVVTFVVGEKRFAWNFNEPSTISEIDLQQVAPSGVLDHSVKVYVRRNPLTDGA
jgi:hypothetical protein